jgi:hypothetical protein
MAPAGRFAVSHLYRGIRGIIMSTLRLGEFDHLLLCHEHAEMLAHNGLASLKSVTWVARSQKCDFWELRVLKYLKLTQNIEVYEHAYNMQPYNMQHTAYIVNAYRHTHV